MKRPTQTPYTITYPDARIVEDDAVNGTYNALVDCSAEGNWATFFRGTGAAKGGEPHHVRVRKKPT